MKKLTVTVQGGSTSVSIPITNFPGMTTSSLVLAQRVTTNNAQLILRGCNVVGSNLVLQIESGFSNTGDITIVVAYQPTD